jgi:hypothetical protein
MNLDSDGGMIYWQGKTEELREKPVPVPLCPPQIPHGLNRALNPGLCGERPATNDLSHGTAHTSLTSQSKLHVQRTWFSSRYRQHKTCDWMRPLLKRDVGKTITMALRTLCALGWSSFNIDSFSVLWVKETVPIKVLLELTLSTVFFLILERCGRT